MIAERVKQLIQMLPPDSIYAKADRGEAPADFRAARDVAAKASAMTDPKFGWAFVSAWLEAEQELPEAITEPEYCRAFCYFGYDNKDEDACDAFRLQTRAELWRRVMVQCMLLLKEYSYERIAKETNLPEAAIRIYAEMFFNVRDRLDDAIYIAQILYPSSTQITWAEEYHLMERPDLLAMRAAHRHGIDVAKRFLGIKVRDTTPDAAVSAKALEARLMDEALHMAQMGFVHQPNIQAINAGRMLIQSSKLGGEQQKSSDDTVGLGRIGMGNAMLDHFQKFMDTDVQHRMKVQLAGQVDSSSS